VYASCVFKTFRKLVVFSVFSFKRKIRIFNYNNSNINVICDFLLKEETEGDTVGEDNAPLSSPIYVYVPVPVIIVEIHFLSLFSLFKNQYTNLISTMSIVHY